MKNIIYILGLLALIYSCNQSASSNNNPKPEPPEDSLDYYAPTPKTLSKAEFRKYVRTLSSFFNTELINGGFNGSILVAKDGVVLYEKYVGYTDLRIKDALTDTTAMHLASTSKPFTAVAVLRLVQENKLSLDDTLQRFFPTLPYSGITVKMLLNHRSGLPNYVYFMDKSKTWDKNNYCTNKNMLDVLIAEKPASNFRPGTRFSYSNTNFVLLAMIVEQLTGIPFPQYMQQKYFGPLQMNHTYIFTLADTAKATHSFNYNRTVWDNDFLEGTYGDKNLYSTPRDILKWDQALYTDQILRKSLLDSAFMPYSLEHPSVHNYGLGFRMLNLPNGKKVIYHFGRWHGFNAAFARLTDERATIIILGNKFNRNIYHTATKSYSIFGNYGRDSDDSEEEHEAPKSEAAPPVKVKAKTPAKTKPGKRAPSRF